MLKVLWSGHYKYVSPYDLKRAVGQYKTMFMGYEQQDSHEFLTILMDLLQLDLQTIIMPVNELYKDNIIIVPIALICLFEI